MSRSETAFETVARQLGRVRDKLGLRDSRAINNAVDLLLGVGDLFYRREEGTREACESEDIHPYLIREGVIDIIAVSRRPLTEREKIELTRRCTSPLNWSLCAGVEVGPSGAPTHQATPVYDADGHFLGMLLDLPVVPPSEGPAKGGEG